MRYISPSILSADFANLKRDVEMLNASSADYIHCDVMDGNFVPNISFGFPVLSAIHRVATKPLDVHLMLEDPGRYVNQFRDAGADILTVHHESSIHLDRLVHQIKDAGLKAGVAICTATPVSVLSEIAEAADLVLLMSVNPGFGGQKFIDNTFKKVIELVELRKRGNDDFVIEIDGGVNMDNAGRLFEAGADILVAGSAVFKAEDPTAMIEELKQSQRYRA